MNSDFYQNQIKKEQFKKIVDAFNVESQSFTDIDFGDDIAIRPNFTISSPDFEKGRHCSISSMSHKSIDLETKRPPNASTGDIITFTIPEVKGLTKEPTEITLELESVKYNKHLGKYETSFVFQDAWLQIKMPGNHSAVVLPFSGRLTAQRSLYRSSTRIKNL